MKLLHLQLVYVDTLSVSQLDNLMRDFEVSAHSGNHGDHGWPNSTYVGGSSLTIDFAALCGLEFS